MSTVDEAVRHLDEVVTSLRGEEYGEYLLDALERYIRRHEGDARRALELALGVWLDGSDLRRCSWAEALIVRLRLVEYLPMLRQCREEALASDSRFPKYWAELFEQSIRLLEEADSR